MFRPSLVKMLLPPRPSAFLGLRHLPASFQHTSRFLASGPPSSVPTVTIDQAECLPRDWREYPNDVLLAACVDRNPGACSERLRREIMAVHEVNWEDAESYLAEVEQESRRIMGLTKSPYKISIFVAASAGVASFPLCFYLPAVKWFNNLFVTTDVPEVKDLETWLEVGSWSWGWMEPPLGQISFVLLCLQYSRSQMLNIGVRPYTGWWMVKRAERLKRKFPLYSSLALRDFAEADWEDHN